MQMSLCSLFLLKAAEQPLWLKLLPSVCQRQPALIFAACHLDAKSEATLHALQFLNTRPRARWDVKCLHVHAVQLGASGFARFLHSFTVPVSVGPVVTSEPPPLNVFSHHLALWFQGDYGERPACRGETSSQLESSAHSSDSADPRAHMAMSSNSETNCFLNWHK